MVYDRKRWCIKEMDVPDTVFVKTVQATITRNAHSLGELLLVSDVVPTELSARVVFVNEVQVAITQHTHLFGWTVYGFRRSHSRVINLGPRDVFS